MNIYDHVIEYTAGDAQAAADLMAKIEGRRRFRMWARFVGAVAWFALWLLLIGVVTEGWLCGEDQPSPTRSEYEAGQTELDWLEWDYIRSTEEAARAYDFPGPDSELAKHWMKQSEDAKDALIRGRMEATK